VAGAVVRGVGGGGNCKPRVLGFQFFPFSKQGEPLGSPLRIGHINSLRRTCGLYVPNSRSYPGFGTLHIAKQRLQRM